MKSYYLINDVGAVALQEMANHMISLGWTPMGGVSQTLGQKEYARGAPLTYAQAFVSNESLDVAKLNDELAPWIR